MLLGVLGEPSCSQGVVVCGTAALSCSAHTCSACSAGFAGRGCVEILPLFEQHTRRATDLFDLV